MSGKLLTRVKFDENAVTTKKIHSVIHKLSSFQLKEFAKNFKIKKTVKIQLFSRKGFSGNFHSI